jgi:hypothetical protein
MLAYGATFLADGKPVYARLLANLPDALAIEAQFQVWVGGFRACARTGFPFVLGVYCLHFLRLKLESVAESVEMRAVYRWSVKNMAKRIGMRVVYRLVRQEYREEIGSMWILIEDGAGS